MGLLIRHCDEQPPGVSPGGKAAALASLSAARFPVPEWFVIPATTLEENGGPTSFEISGSLARLIVDTAKEIAPDAPFFAVRSSALEEDGEFHSFAGQLDSFLFVRPGEIPIRVIDVWRSGFGEQVRGYRLQRGLAAAPRTPSVIVQRMIDPEWAGVAFSADPVSGKRGHAVVSAVRGAGSALVSGEADADTFTVDRRGRIVKETVSPECVAHRTGPGNGGRTAEGVAGGGPAASIPGFPEALAREVAALARSAAKHFGRPQDIEWAVSGGKLWLLQSRPITSLAGLPDPQGECNVWDNANIAESYSGVTTPLTFSFARGIYESVYREFARLMGVPGDRIEENRDLFPRMLGFVGGRIYYNLISWYRLLSLLPGFAFNRGFMEQMMGVKEGLPDWALARFAPSTNRWSRMRDGLAMGRSWIGLGFNHFLLPGQMKAFHARLDRALQSAALPLEEMRPDELAGHYRDLERQLLTRWDAPLVNDFFAMIFFGMLGKVTVTWCGDREGTLPNDLLCREGGMISAEPARRVRELAAIVAGDPGAVALLCDGSLGAITRWMDTSPEFRAGFEAYLEKFGNRCLEELKLESVTLCDEPLPLLRSIGRYARRVGAAVPPSVDPVDPVRTAAEARVRSALAAHPIRRVLFGWILRHARRRVRDRENLRFERTRLFGHVRRLFVEFGKRLHAERHLGAVRDVFYLTAQEILGFVDGTTVTTDLSALVALRKREIESFRCGQPPSDRFMTRGAVHLGNDFQADSGDDAAASPAVAGAELKGLGCCPGVVRGRVRVVTDARTGTLVSGEILVATRTDPGWIMLFPSAAGLLVEHGSLLSHSAIVAREMGIPAVVSIRGLTARLRTGDWVELDGGTGVVRRLSGPVDPAEAEAVSPRT